MTVAHSAVADGTRTGTGIPRLRRFGGMVLAVALAFWTQYALRSGAWWEALFLGIGAASVFLISTEKSNRSASQLPVASIRRARRWGWPLLPGGVAVVLAVAGWMRRDPTNPTLEDWLIVGASALLWIAAALLWDELSPRAERARWSRQEIAVVSAITLVALAVRLYRLGTLPFGTWYDEAANGLEALHILNAPQRIPIYNAGVNATGHYLGLVAASMHYFGVETFSVRLVSALMGAAAVIATYLVGRELHGAWFGAVAALWMVFSRWSVNFSRLGMYNIATPLFALLTLYFLLRAWRRGSVVDYALAGLWIGLGLCYYVSFQLVVAAVFAFWILAALLLRDLLRKSWPGVLVLLVSALLVYAPVLHFAIEKPDLYLSRIRATSLLADKEAGEALPALWANTRKHLLMFHYRGDPNGRHNLPGDPMVDAAAGALMLLAIPLCLRRARQPQYIGLPLLLLIGLLGGILSLDFEAPQSLRSVGSMPFAYLLAALPLVEMRAEWRRAGGWRFPKAEQGTVFVLVAVVAVVNLHWYFGRQARDFASWNAFSTPETIAANLLREKGSDTQAFLISLFYGHPTVRFLAGGIDYRPIDTTAQLPIADASTNATNREMLLILDTERRTLFEEARRLYPDAEFREERAEFGGPTVVYAAIVGPEQQAAIQGLEARYYIGGEWEGEPILRRAEDRLDVVWPEDAPVPQPFSVEWEGVLLIETYGLYQFELAAPGEASLYIGEELVAEAGNDEGDAAGVMLAQGRHPIRLRAVGGEGNLTLWWRPANGEAGPLPGRALYHAPVTANGLLGRYFPNDRREGPEVFARVDARVDFYFHVTPLSRPYSVEWSGKIAIPTAGVYGFGLQSIDESVLWIDGNEVVRSPGRNAYGEGEIELSKGLHDIEIFFADRTDHTRVRLTWRPPGANVGMGEVVPSEVLFPPLGNYERITLPRLQDVQPGFGLVAGPEFDVPLAGEVTVVVSGLVAPRGVAVSGDHVFVTEPDAARIAVYTTGGEPVRAITDAGEVALVEPFDAAAGPDGTVYVLDAGRGDILAFSGDGKFLRVVNVNRQEFGRARGLSVDGSSTVWIAHTAGASVVALRPDGQQAMMIPRLTALEGGDAQPVDVAASEGGIYVTDPAQGQLIRFDRDGRRLLGWDILASNTLDGPHLTFDGVTSDGAGRILMTEPESGKVVRLDLDGRRQGSWSLRLLDGPAAKPTGVATDGAGDIWVADAVGGRLIRIVVHE